MTKRYLALVAGRLPQTSGSMMQWLAKDRVTNQSRVVPEWTPDARRSSLSWELVQSGASRQLLSILLESGRSHQIRVQLASLGCPILGDVKYGSRVRLPDHGLALHASELTFRHPVLPDLVTVTAPPPTCWDAWLHEAVA
jgi:23S rRNA pseudouridine1911/1915/1917 synthase